MNNNGYHGSTTKPFNPGKASIALKQIFMKILTPWEKHSCREWGWVHDPSLGQ